MQSEKEYSKICIKILAVIPVQEWLTARKALVEKENEILK